MFICLKVILINCKWNVKVNELFIQFIKMVDKYNNLLCSSNSNYNNKCNLNVRVSSVRLAKVL